MANQQYASFLKRFLAVFLDSLITFIPFWIIVMVPATVLTLSGMDTALTNVICQLTGLLLGWIYYAWMESSPTQGTLGKMICKIRVTDLDGNRISFQKATGRFFAKYISGLILAIGYIMAAFTARRQALHDIMAGTLVLEGRPVTSSSPADVIDI